MSGMLTCVENVLEVDLEYTPDQSHRDKASEQRSLQTLQPQNRFNTIDTVRAPWGLSIFV